MLNVLARLAVIALVVARALLGGVDGQVLCLPLVDCCTIERADDRCVDGCVSVGVAASEASCASEPGRIGHPAPLHLSAPAGSECGCHVHVPLPADELSASKGGAGARARVDVPAVQAPAPALVGSGPGPVLSGEPWPRDPDASRTAQARALRVTRLLI